MGRPFKWTYREDLPAELQQELLSAGERFYSTQKLTWLCPNDHKYEAPVYDRLRGKGCPYCSFVRLKVGYNDFGSSKSPLLLEWDHGKNQVLPEEVSLKSKTKLWWKCEKEHSWKDSVSHRMTGRGCPYCSGHRVVKGVTDLFTLRKDLIKEWHPTRNSFTPSEVSAQSNKKVWWLCSEGHERKASIANRFSGKGCKVCARGGVSENELLLQALLKQKYLSLVTNTRQVVPPLELDCFIPEKKIGVDSKNHCFLLGGVIGLSQT